MNILRIDQTINQSVNRPNGDIRCVILADNTSDELPTDAGEAGGIQGQKIIPGSIAATPEGDIAIMKNDGTWGEWI